MLKKNKIKLMLVSYLVSNHQKQLVSIRRDIDLHSHYSSYFLRWMLRFGIIYFYFYNCRQIFRPIGTLQYSQSETSQKIIRIERFWNSDIDSGIRNTTKCVRINIFLNVAWWPNVDVRWKKQVIVGFLTGSWEQVLL